MTIELLYSKSFTHCARTGDVAAAKEFWARMMLHGVHPASLGVDAELVELGLAHWEGDMLRYGP